MPDLPTLHLTNWSSRKLHGPGRKFTIMAAPRRWEHGDGVVSLLVPPLRLVRGVQDRSVTLDEYRRVYGRILQEYLDAGRLVPGELMVAEQDGDDWEGIGPNPARMVKDGDTLCCSCAVAKAKRGECHRSMAAPFLVRAGWRVILDGVEVPHAS